MKYTWKVKAEAAEDFLPTAKEKVNRKEKKSEGSV
jgi:hypothetical protein